MSLIAIGDPVYVDGARGIVRYVGEVATSKTVGALYAGIEWDNPSRGKNDGSVQDSNTGVVTRYFTCSSGERGASFVKIELVSPGRTFSAALVERYCDVSTGSDSGALVGVSGKSVPVVLVGDDKVREQQALGKLTHVVLREAGVSIIGPSLGSVCPKVREVDLQGNLLHSWGEVAELGRSLPLLRVLNLSDNALPPLTEGLAADLAGCLPSLRTLIVSDTPLDWPSLMRLCKLAPGLEELHATGCGFSELTPTPAVFNAGDATVSACEGSFLAADVFPRVKTLNLSGNPLPWEQIFALARMPCLSWLLLNDCKLTEVWTSSTPLGDAITSAPATGGGGGSTTLPPFPLLEQLSLAGSAITASWVLDALDSFPSLRSVRLTNGDFSLPLHPPLGPVEARQVVIARCPRITSLCGSEVRLREREDAEKAYARRVAGLWGESRGLGAAGLTEVFGTHTVGPQPEFNLLAPPPNSPGNAATATTTLTMGIPAGFSKGSDAGIIRARGAATVYCTPLDPWGLGAKDPSAAASLQAAFPRFFLLAAKFDLLAPGKAGSGGLAGGTLASSSVPLLLRSMAGGSCMMDPVPRRLPLATTVHDVKIMAGKLFKCQVSLQRLSFRENSASYPSLMDDDQRPLSYYGVCADGEILVEEVDPAEARRQEQEAKAAQEAKIAAQAAQGEALRKAQAMSVSAQRSGAVAASDKVK